MDGDFESDNLDMFIDWNDDQFQPTFLQTDTPGLTGLEDANLMQQFNSQFELPPVPSTSFQTMAETTEPTSWSHEGSSSAAALTFVPNPLPPLPNPPLLHATELSHPLSSADELMFDGAIPSGESQEVTLTGYFNELPDLQNENSVAQQAIHLAQNPMNQLSMPNRIENNIINQSTSYPTLVRPNPAKPGNESGYSGGQRAPPQRPALFPLRNHISNSNAAWNYRPEHINSSAPGAYGAQYAASFTQSPQSFTTVHNQVGSHASELQQIVGLRSQNSVRPVYPTCPRSEAYTNFQPSLTRMPTNPFQQGYRPVLPDPAAPFASSLANYGQNPILQPTRALSYGSGSSLHPTYRGLFGNQDQVQHHYPQVRMPNGHGQQSSASVQQWFQIGDNQRMMSPNLQRQINTIGSQTLISGILGHSSTRTTEVTSSRVPNSREAEIAQVLRMQQEATLSTNEVQTSRDTGKQLATSSTGTQPSNAIQRILNMNPARSAGWNTRFITEQISNSMPTERVPYVPPRRGRPPKRRDIEGPSSSQPRKSQKVSTETAKGRTSVTPNGAQRTPESVVNRGQNAILPNPLSAPGHFLETAYDMEFEMQGRPLDPKLFKPSPAQKSHTHQDPPSHRICSPSSKSGLPCHGFPP
ncbi:hypothetical protein VNO80_18545 [Phaseolus coccineus]|uniref:Uncharacterized protein n=1 Tax=Phaseolus coccineus TaxID=3886 RepID=A0AAN9QZJ4_PHACN